MNFGLLVTRVLDEGCGVEYQKLTESLRDEQQFQNGPKFGNSSSKVGLKTVFDIVKA